MLTTRTAPVESDSSQRNTPPSCALEMSGVEADNIEEDPHIKSKVNLQAVVKNAYFITCI